MNAERPGCCPKLVSTAIPDAITEPDNRVSKIKVVARVILGIYAWWRSPKLTSIAFTAGFIGGMYRQTQSDNKLEDSEFMPVCAIGYFGFLTGKKVDKTAACILTSLLAWDHLEHGSRIFPSFVAAGVGLWAGSTLVSATWGEQWYKRFRLTPPQNT